MDLSDQSNYAIYREMARYISAIGLTDDRNHALQMEQWQMHFVKVMAL